MKKKQKDEKKSPRKPAPLRDLDPADLDKVTGGGPRHDVIMQ